MSAREQGPAPMLAAEEQARGDNLAFQIRFREIVGLPTEWHRAAMENAYDNAARYREPSGGDR